MVDRLAALLPGEPVLSALLRVELPVSRSLVVWSSGWVTGLWLDRPGP